LPGTNGQWDCPFQQVIPWPGFREEWQHQRRVEAKQSAETTAANLRESIALMDQTDEDEATVQTVRIYASATGIWC